MLVLPIVLGLTLGLLFPLACFVVATKIETKVSKDAKSRGDEAYWTLMPQRRKRDFKTGKLVPTEDEVDFDPRHGHYMKCGEIVITIASASLVFIPTLHFTHVLPWLGLSMVLLGFTVVYTLSFMGLLTFFYEMFLNNPESFTMFRSNTLFSLGFGGLSCFASAYFVLSILIGSAMASGAFVGSGH
jgi:hypothetical protein